MSDETISLVKRLAADVEETSARFRRHGTLFLIGAVLFAVLTAAQKMWTETFVCLGLGVALFVLGRFAAKKSGPAAAEPVLWALRDEPERVEEISHTTTSDSRRIFVSHWVVVKTRDGKLRVRADDWEQLIAQLQRRCPDAKLTGL
jgi:hypothetical protein